jgi:hypothetical protein
MSQPYVPDPELSEANRLMIDAGILKLQIGDLNQKLSAEAPGASKTELEKKMKQLLDQLEANQEKTLEELQRLHSRELACP